MPRVYPILDTSSLERRGYSDWLSAARAMIEGGARILQLRHKGEWTSEVFDRAGEIASECTRHGVTLVVNDRADMAKMLSAGLHVGQDDLPPADCRALLGAGLLGYSTHTSEQLAAADREPVDYLAFGPVFPTASKQNPDPVAGLDRLGIARSLTRKPLVAIGGITRENARSIFDGGADSLALIADLLPDVLTESTIRGRMEEWQLLTQ